MNAGNILKPALSRGEIQVIGATTFNEYRKYIEKDQALERRFQPVRVEEPSVADTLAVMNGIKHYYEQHHHVQVPADVLSATVTLSERYITDRYLPIRPSTCWTKPAPAAIWPTRSSPSIWGCRKSWTP